MPTLSLTLAALSCLPIIVYYGRIYLTTPARDSPQPPPPAVPFRIFTPTTLFSFNGIDDKPVYIAVRGRVFDVTRSKHFYGLDGPYANFAGRDASRGLAVQSFDEEVLTKDLKGPLDELGDLDADQWENLEGWETLFLGKYIVVGRLVAEDDLT